MESMVGSLVVVCSLVATASLGCDSDSDPSSASCADGVAGVWMMPGYPAYMQINDSCEVTLFCDLDKGHHTTGYLEGDVITLTGVATLNYTIMADVLTILDVMDMADVDFARQASADVIPAECY